MRHRIGIIIVTCVTACAGGPTVFPRAKDQRIQGTYVVVERPRNTIYRDELVATIAGGIPRFLQKVGQRAAKHKDPQGVNVFDGYVLEVLRPASDWMAFDFAPGDQITHVNGTFLGQHPDVIIPFFESLAAENEINVALIRGGEKLTVRLVVVDRKVEGKPQSAGH